MRKAFRICGLGLVAAMTLGIAACAGLTGSSVQPLTQAQISQNLDMAVYLLKSAGCLTSSLAAIAQPIVSISADAKGQQVLSASAGSGATACSITVPPTALPAPAPASAPLASAPVPTS